VLGVLGVSRNADRDLLTPDEQKLLTALVDQAAISIERIRFAGEMDAARLAAETERLRSALLKLALARPEDPAGVDHRSGDVPAPKGYRVLEAGTAQGALDIIMREAPEVVLLDLGLPDQDGLEVIRQLRAAESKVAIIVLSSRGDERGKVEALDLGTDDYVTKPFGMAELIARIRTALRHRVQRQGTEPLFTHGDLSVDLTRRRVTVRGEEVKLSNKEWDILRLLALHAGKVLTHRMIMQEVWGPKVDVQYLRIYVRQLRQKLEERPDQPQHILTETGVGYRLQTDGGCRQMRRSCRRELDEASERCSRSLRGRSGPLSAAPPALRRTGNLP